VSGIAAYWYLDGHPAEPGLLERMTAAVEWRGPDGIHHWVSADGSVGVGHLAFWTTPEAVREAQPLADESGRCVLTWDGRLDNREELRRDLEARGAMLRDDTDAELVLKAYLVWAEDAPRRLLGDFAFALWDARARRFFCARDFPGIKPLFYFFDGRRFLVGSQVKQLFADPAVPCRPDEVTVACHLAWRLGAEGDRTLFEGVRRLPLAHWMSVSERGVQLERYWKPDFTPLRRARDDEYAEQFRSVFREAVRCRMRSHGRVGADLSGGLDSSSVVGMVQSLIRSGAVADWGFETFSSTFPGWPCDESVYIDEVDRLWGLGERAHRVPSRDDCLRHDYRGEVEQHWELPAYPHAATGDSVRALARLGDFRVNLTGDGGDEWFTGSPRYLADLVRRRALLALVRQLSVRPRPRLWMDAFRPVLVAVLPDVVKRAVRWARHAPTLIGPRLARRASLLMQHQLPLDGSAPFAKQLQASVCAGMNESVTERAERSAARSRVEDRHPLQDRRLVELALTLPDDSHGGVTKHHMRRALLDLLPSRVLLRRDKADFSITVAAALATPDVGQAFDALVLERLGWVHTAELRRRRLEVVARKQAGEQTFRGNLPALWLAFGLDVWYRTVFLHEATKDLVDPGAA
jgi:asparagine synthase (glutamine-hydrolysing)